MPQTGGGGRTLNDICPPVGSWLHLDFNPNEKWPTTTWEQVEEGRYLVSAGDSYAPGEEYGANTHSLTAEENGEHTHGWKGMSRNSQAVNGTYTMPLFGNDTFAVTGGIQPSGEGKPHNNMPLSTAVNLWHRIN